MLDSILLWREIILGFDRPGSLGSPSPVLVSREPVIPKKHQMNKHDV